MLNQSQMCLLCHQASTGALASRRGVYLQESQFQCRYFCWICGSVVDLESCKADENGIAVHENCYLLRLVLAAESNRLLARKPAQSIRRMAVSDVS